VTLYGEFEAQRLRHIAQLMGEDAMMSRRIRRREILKVGAAATAFVSFGAKLGRTEAAPGHAQIDAVLRRATEAGDVPGVVAVAASDKGLFYEGAFGTRDLTKGPAMTPDTIFRIASMTKAVTSVAAMGVAPSYYDFSRSGRRRSRC
jgi:CubicO group peptidase (beta-lactamase class C family)